MSQTSQVKLNLPKQLRNLLEAKAQYYGFSVPTYIKFVLANDIKEPQYPVYQVSERTLKALQKAKEDFDSGNTKKFTTPEELKDYFKKLL